MIDVNKFLQRHVISPPHHQYPWDYVEWLNSEWKSKHSTLLLDGKHAVATPFDVDAVNSITTYVEIQPYVVITGQVTIGSDVRIGPFTFLRGPLIIGDGVQIGPHAEIARSIIMDRAKISHKNIVLDSVIGPAAHLAGFATTCNQCVGRNYINARDDKGGAHRVLGKYGCTVEGRASIGAGVYLMPGTYVPAGQMVPGPAIVHGLGKVKAIKQAPRIETIQT